MSYIKPAFLPETAQQDWLEVQARFVANAKEISESDFGAAKAALMNAYTNIYRAVAFDVDGTLTPQGDIHITRDMAGIVAELLLRGVPILLISGRGRQSIRQAVEELLELSNLHPSYLRRLRGVTHNGLLYLSTPNVIPPSPLSNEEPIAEPLPCVPKLERALAEKLREVGIEPRITTEPSGPDPFALRIVAPAGVRPNAIKSVISQVVTDLPVGEHNVCVGTYGAETSIDISSTHKGLALEVFAKDIGISVEAILRIGDRGDEEGNDFDLLNAVSGFSVGKFSRSFSGSHPVASDDGSHLLKGESATRTLLDRVLLFPAISIEAQPIDRRLASLRAFEQVALKRSREETVLTLTRVRNRLRYLLDPRSREGLLPTLTLDDLVDDQSGGIRLRDYEIPDIGEFAEVSKLFGFDPLLATLEEPPRAQWWMYTDSSVLLRGPRYYQGMTNYERRFSAYLPECLKFIYGACKVLKAYGTRRVNFASFKIVLGILDNIRNFLLISTYAAFEAEAESEGYERTAAFHSLLVEHSALLIETLVGPAAPWLELVSRLHAHLETVKSAFETLLTSQSENDVKVRDREIRSWRECDNFLENYTAVQLALSEFAEQYGTRTKKMCVMGLAYGGLELPSIAKAVGRRQDWDITAGLFKISIYHDKVTGSEIRNGRYEEIRERIKRSAGVFFDDGSFKTQSDRPMIIADDNTTTGVTLQLARDYFVATGADVRGALIVRFPGANRHVQMAMPGHGFPDPEMLFSFIRGLVAPSPYTRLLFPGKTPDAIYKDNVGVFCKSRERIVRYLLKNGTPCVGEKELGSRARQ
jgi:hypothetical protein